MKTTIIFALFLLQASSLFAQESELNIPMTTEAWEFEEGSVEFIEHRSIPAVRGVNGGSKWFLKDFEFQNGTIEFDVEMNEAGFVGINFRESEDRKEAENFYIRAFWPVSPQSRTTLQYATVVDGNLLWDVTDDYQAAANIRKEGWNHVKLVISGRQMKVYVNDLQQPAMHVPILEGETESGGISLTGNAVFGNLVIRPDVTEGLFAEPGYDPTHYDSRYLRNWMVTEPISFPFERAIVNADIPDSTTSWKPIRAEHRSLVNLSRAFGATPEGERRIVWLKTTIASETTQQRRLSFGFSDEVWVFINGQVLLFDKNYYGTPSMKEPKGRSTIENTSVMLPLQEGENELMIGVSNFFFGWGIIARLDDTAGLTLQ